MSTNIAHILGFYKLEEYNLMPFEGEFSLSIVKNTAKKVKAPFQLIYKHKGHSLNNTRLSGLFLVKKFANKTIYRGDVKHLDSGLKFYLIVSDLGIVEIRKY